MLEALALLLFAPGIPMTALFLAVMLYYDIKTREIPIGAVAALAPGIAISFALYVYFSGLLFGWGVEDFAMSMAITGVLVATTIALARSGQMGYGDAILVSVVGLLNPHVVPASFVPVKVPLILLVLFFGLAYLVAEVLWNVAHNARRWAMFKKATEGCTGLERLYYMLAGKVFTREEFASKRFYFPLLHEGMKRKAAKVGVEPLESSEFEVKGEYVVATKGFAFATFLATGYVLALAYMILQLVTSTC